MGIKKKITAKKGRCSFSQYFVKKNPNFEEHSSVINNLKKKVRENYYQRMPLSFIVQII